MVSRLEIGEIDVDVVFKDIKNVHLSVYPPTGTVRISAPSRMSLDTIRAFAVSKLNWIKKQQSKIQQQPRETVREYVDRESHYLWGARYLLKVIEIDQRPAVELEHRRMLLHVRPGAERPKRRDVVEAWYREQIKEAVTPLLAKWQPVMGVNVEKFYVRRMKTKWGSCNITAGTIRLNTELAKKPPECLEYVVVHEMVHLLERHHNARFRALMDEFLPQWQHYRDELNRAPLAREYWRC